MPKHGVLQQLSPMWRTGFRASSEGVTVTLLGKVFLKASERLLCSLGDSVTLGLCLSPSALAFVSYWLQILGKRFPLFGLCFLICQQE